MPRPNKFDFLVIYSNKCAYSAANTKYAGTTPFSSKGKFRSRNAAYRYFLQYGKRLGLRVAFATVNDICGTGKVGAYWTYHNAWKRVLQPARTTVIFDKFSSVKKTNIQAYKTLVGTSRHIKLYHNHTLRSLFDNKITTYNELGQYMVPTVAVKIDSAKTIRNAIKALQKKISHCAHANDFSQDLVIKDVFGGGGDHIYKVQSAASFKKIAHVAADIHFLLQPFLQTSDFTLGHSIKPLPADLRVIIGNKTILQSYLRTAKKGDFRANVKQGGSIAYIPIHKIPQQVLKTIAKIQKTTNLKGALYTLDFMRSKKGNLYLVEGNASPGLTWSNTEDERRAKQLIRLIVHQLQLMAKQKH